MKRIMCNNKNIYKLCDIMAQHMADDCDRGEFDTQMKLRDVANKVIDWMEEGYV